MITVKEEFLGSEKVKKAIRLGGYQVLAMWLAIKGYVARKASGGFVPDEAIEDLEGAPKGPRKALQALVECGLTDQDGNRGAGLVDQVEHGWMLHDYDDHGTPRDRELARREAARERKRRQRDRETLSRGTERDSHAGQSVTENVTSQVPRADTRPGPRGHTRDPSPAQPRSDQPDTSAQGPDRLVAAAAAAEPTGRIPCPEDLALTSDQIASLDGTPGIPAWALEIMRGEFVAAERGDLTKTMTLAQWRKCLSMACCSRWSNSARRPKKPSAEQKADDTGGYGKTEEWLT